MGPGCTDTRTNGGEGTMCQGGSDAAEDNSSANVHDWYGNVDAGCEGNAIDGDELSMESMEFTDGLCTRFHREAGAGGSAFH